MGELVDRDQEHLRLLMWGYYLVAATTGFTSLFALLFVAFGAFASSLIPAKQNSAADPRMAGLFFIGIGLAFLGLSLGATLIAYFTGRSLRDRRNRGFCLITAGLSCLQIPWGTAIGICTIAVLNRSTVRSLFEAHGAHLPMGSAPPPAS